VKEGGGVGLRGGGRGGGADVEARESQAGYGRRGQAVICTDLRWRSCAERREKMRSGADPEEYEKCPPHC
jgi:hypothetical protein